MIGRAIIGASLVASATLAGLAYRHRSPPEPNARHLDPAHLPTDVAPPVLLAFTSPLCLACERTPGLVAEALDVTEDELTAGEAPLAFTTVDVGEHPQLAEALDVRGTPTVAGVDTEGRVRFLSEGNPSVDELADHLARLEDA